MFVERGFDALALHSLTVELGGGLIVHRMADDIVAVDQEDETTQARHTVILCRQDLEAMLAWMN